MLYYIYILSGPLKETIIPLPPNHYSFILQSDEDQDRKEENDKVVLYIPCDKVECKKKLAIILDENNSENNKYIIQHSLIPEEVGKEYSLPLNTPIYSNDIPIFLMSDNNDFTLDSSYFKKNKKKIFTRKKIFILLILTILFSISFIFYINRTIEKKNVSTLSKSQFFKGFQGKNGYYCTFDNSYITSKEKIGPENKIFYIDKSKIENLVIKGSYKKIHLILNDKTKPIVNFIYHNNNEKIKIIDAINSHFSENCYPTIKEISIPNIINDINKLELTKTIGYTVEEKNNRLTFIFNNELSASNKEKLNTYIKKQTAIFGRKFIFYRENISNPMLKNKAILQEDRGYIFLDDQHRYFPQG
ncbi:PrgH/EprH family type III secretion apparatus protein [Hafnia alvei]|uniref:PrgH/EprH family type III secretion apparatus protein n=1 Tax=Proteus vulgaris TaxID=585 RepID=UPI00299D2ECD|nr:PrgH/EprH family type III secretion apparatus protein [Proteus vulgaris]WOO49393.1 PrgH/EprH family type III secretion apparatus protein [Hafnia alvei]WPF03859.1 PrgH/EprH family type III secretion apparatus protein [Proteus vulgaris]